jgi:hypothetical protein
VSYVTVFKFNAYVDRRQLFGRDHKKRPSTWPRLLHSVDRKGLLMLFLDIIVVVKRERLGRISEMSATPSGIKHERYVCMYYNVCSK